MSAHGSPKGQSRTAAAQSATNSRIPLVEHPPRGRLQGLTACDPGDGCFLVFETPSAAVLFALRLQQAHGEEPDLPGVRTGIHMGEVSEQPGPDGDVAHPRVEGLAVELAARICGLARPAQVLMSSSVADSARQRLDSHAFGQPIRWPTHGSYSLN